MNNLSQRRFQDTAENLQGCYDHIHDPLPEYSEESLARLRLIEICRHIVMDCNDDPGDE